MEAQMVAWLEQFEAKAFWMSAIAFLALNGFAAAVVFVRRDRELVNRWTSRVLAANLVLVGTGIGAPLVSMAARVAINAASPLVRAALPGPASDPQERSEQPRELRAVKLR